jgi:hypothetical protein
MPFGKVSDPEGGHGRLDPKRQEGHRQGGSRYAHAHAHAHGEGKKGWTKFQRMDMVGAGILTACLCLFILGLTSECTSRALHAVFLVDVFFFFRFRSPPPCTSAGGTTHGWTSVDFLVPFLLSWGLFAFFFLWEYKQHPERALLPMSLLRLPNLLLWCFTALTPFLWWATVRESSPDVLRDGFSCTDPKGLN